VGDDENGKARGAAPKLTLGQRILTALPNLDRQRQSPAGTRRPPAARRPTEDTPAGDEAASAPASAGSRTARGAKAGARTGIKPWGQAGTETEERNAAGTSEADDHEVIEPDEVVSSEGARAGSGTRPARPREPARRATGAGQQGRRPDPIADMSNEELTYSIKRIDDRERTYAMFAGPLGAAIGIVLTIAAIHYNPPLHHKGHVANSVTELYGVARVVLGAVVLLTAITRRRSLVAFALLFLGTAEGFPFALLFWGLGGWMIWRVFRYQKALTARGVAPQRGRASQGPRVAARTGASDARQRVQSRQAARSSRRKRQPEPAGPPASKRYTPPKPPRPRPPAPS